MLRGLFDEGRGRVLVFCWLGWVFDFYDLVLFAFVKHDVAADLGLDLRTDIAWIDGWTLAATAVGGFAFGRIADRIGRRTALTTSILIYSAGAFATAFADGFVSLLVARLVTGIGVGGEWGVGHAVVAETYPDRLRNRAAAVLQAGSPVAMALAAAVGCFAAPAIGWQACFGLSAAPALLVFFARRAIPGEDRAPGRNSGGLLDLFRGGYRRSSVALLGLLVLHMTGFWSTYAWLPSLLLRDGGATIEFVGWFQIGVNAVHVVADVAFGPLADRFGRRRTFAVFCLVFASGLVAIALGFEHLRQDLALFGFAMAAVGLGAGTWSCFGVLFAECYRSDVRATAASGFYNLARGSQLFTQPLLGYLFVVTGSFAVALWVGAATAVLSAVLIPLVRPADRSRSRP
ncbi:MAG: MFS transporter [Planctomycetes bacterium]|nr:MFS transporter [Planctomycetota bacterium]